MTDDKRHDERIVNQFTRWAQRFGELPVHSDADGLRKTLDAAMIGADHRVLDVACGPGIVACAAARSAAFVTGLDLTPAMIQQARGRQQALGIANIDWRIGDATALPFPDAAFDRVMTRYSFHHLPEPIAALREMTRVCRPGGRVVVIDATPAPDCQTGYDRMERLRDPSHSSAPTIDQLRRLGAEAGLDERVIDSYRLDARLVDLADAETLPALLAMFDEDIASGKDRIGVAARYADDGVRFHFPVSIVAWERPAGERGP
ncbi:MAG TPA: methyltransferase domain-containing protein [Methylosinus sp.]|jgi:ubiquinone/menaquinone biosynthesis C-methylase UbiE|uniref:class I SAM-dependent methyltransferase n=1 Tax=Hyphomicrobiales TaxID=356 RepID=UPI002F937C55